MRIFIYAYHFTNGNTKEKKTLPKTIAGSQSPPHAEVNANTVDPWAPISKISILGILGAFFGKLIFSKFGAYGPEKVQGDRQENFKPLEEGVSFCPHALPSGGDLVSRQNHPNKWKNSRDSGLG